MKKVLNWVLSLVGFVLLAGLLFISLNERIGFINLTSYQSLINFLKNYGAIIIVGALVFVNIIGKSVIRIIFTIIFIAIAAFYVFASVFPAEFIKLFGIA